MALHITQIAPLVVLKFLVRIITRVYHGIGLSHLMGPVLTTTTMVYLTTTLHIQRATTGTLAFHHKGGNVISTGAIRHTEGSLVLTMVGHHVQHAMEVQHLLSSYLRDLGHILNMCQDMNFFERQRAFTRTALTQSSMVYHSLRIKALRLQRV
jgi:hypothetical protein